MLIGHVSSLHLHPEEKGGPVKGGAMIDVTKMTLVEGKGILGNTRYFEKKTRSGHPSPRQVSIIDRSMIQYHANRVGDSDCLPAGAIRSNIETTLETKLWESKKVHDGEIPYCPYSESIGDQFQIGDTAIIELTLTRTPCWEMDVIKSGLQQSMKGDTQGCLAKIIKSGVINLRDPVYRLLNTPKVNPNPNSKID